MRNTTCLFFILGWALSACGGPPCRSPSDCELGFYCVLNVGGSGVPRGECVQDCASPEDCPQPDSNVTRSICTNEGRCRIEARPPRLSVFEPELDQVYEEGTRRLRVSGEVESAAEQVTVTVNVNPINQCFGGPSRSVLVTNPNPGEFTVVPFVIDGIVVDTGRNGISVSAAVQGSKRTSSVDIEVDCPDCATIQLDRPFKGEAVSGLELPLLSGVIEPQVARGLWRVHSLQGDIFDGAMEVQGGLYSVDRIPLFAGLNRVEVLVSGVGQGLGEARCSVTVASSVAREDGLRAVLNWDGSTSDLDIHLIGPDGLFGDPASTLSGRSRNPIGFSGIVRDDTEGFGPETIQVSSIPDGVYGLIVEPVFDASDPGTNATMRVLFDGRLITPIPAGPRNLSSDRGELWVLGTLSVVGGQAEFRLVDEVVGASLPPTTKPSAWPDLYVAP